MDLRIEVAVVRQAAGALRSQGAGLAAAARLAGDRSDLAAGGPAWGGDRLGVPFAAAYPGARDAALALVARLADTLAGAGQDLATLADRVEQADAESAAAFPGGA